MASNPHCRLSTPQIGCCVYKRQWSAIPDTTCDDSLATWLTTAEAGEFSIELPRPLKMVPPEICCYGVNRCSS